MRRFLILLFSCAALYSGIYFVFLFFTDVGALKTQYVKVVYNGKGQEPTIAVEPRRPASWVNVKDISELAVAAIVISEDAAFYQHKGFDPNQLRESFEKDMEEHRFARGGSTITQQVVKNVYLNGEKSLWRKGKELILAMRLERQVGKRKILETYLNVAEFGEGLYGIGPASRFYFQKSPSALSAKEGAFLAMLLPSPKRYSVSFRKHALTPYARGIVQSLLEKLYATHRLSEQQYAQEVATPLSFEAPVPSPVPAMVGASPLPSPAPDLIPTIDEEEEPDTN